MKYLLVLLIALLIVWQWRTNRSSKGRDPAADASNGPIEMLACSHCGIHIAAHEAARGESGVYCSAAHQRLHEG